ncbi:unnamed protein product [Caenorhabditis bovis]|uniref:GP-PDE domain-containing protein n=1 Tax=Caenorhabditis bovis TaxID=2654633 RepID=A0A8S1EG98_9PELO|nr:unnamed protein product [Caenorhabditis bovis]
MVPMLIWFILILILALIALLAIKFLAYRYTINTFLIDVRMTKDGMLIIHKDSAIVDSYNNTYEIADTHWLQLNKLKLPGNNSILTFDEAFEWSVNLYQNLILNIESWNSDMFTYIEHKIMQKNLYKSIAVSTTSVRTALMCRLKNPRVTVGLSWSSRGNSFENGVSIGSAVTHWMFVTLDSILYWGMKSMIIPNFVGVDFMIIPIADADITMIRDLKDLSIEVIIDDIQTVVQFEYFFSQLKCPIIAKPTKQMLNLLSTFIYPYPGNNTKSPIE